MSNKKDELRQVMEWLEQRQQEKLAQQKLAQQVRSYLQRISNMAAQTLREGK